MKTKLLLVTMVTVVAMVASTGIWAHEEGSDSCQGEGPTYAKHARMPMLTPEQREQVKAKIAEMEEAGASREEVREAVADMLRAWGIERPQRGAGRGDRAGILQQLTPEQREQLQGKTAELREQGASMEQVREAVGDMLQGWGIEAPRRDVGPRWGQPGQPPQWGQQAGPPRWGQQVAPPQWGHPGQPPQWGQQGPPPQWGQQGPPPQWGQQGPAPQWGQRGFGQQGMGMMQQLTPEQREEVQAKITEMKEAGASREEIHGAVRELFEGWGVEPRPHGPQT